VKKGAMFGLDARIALAIFGALSVISGAALYSAIEQSRLENSRQRFIETAKAVEQFLLDTGEMPSNYSGISYNISELVNKTALNGWNGPYIDYSPVSTYHIRSEGIPGFGFYLYKQINSTLGTTTAASSGTCTDVNDCGWWLKTHISGISDPQAYALKLDDFIDGGDGKEKGKLRIHYYAGDVTDPILFYYVMPVYSL
tara:strand:- start:1605 stop:2198 length:594 start_codon:yes stop_codon:yes gene_type:complete